MFRVARNEGIGVYTFQFSGTQNQEMIGVFVCNIQPIPWYTTTTTMITALIRIRWSNRMNPTYCMKC